MSIDHGMNIDEVRALAQHFNSVSTELNDLAGAIDQRVSSTSWLGPRAEQFKRQWWPGHRSRLQKMSRDLEDFRRIALANADDQERASGGQASASTGGAAPTAPPPEPATAPEAVPSAATGSVMPPGRSIADVQAKYDAWATGRFAPGGESHYQCTAWANFRWHELGYTGAPVGGNGKDMAFNAPGDISATPTLHAMASSGATSSNGYGHVMIVEEISADGSRIRVSEMNVGISRGDPKRFDEADFEGSADEYSDGRWITRATDGTWRGSKGEPINFAALPR